jgi:hypothetical protein
MLQVKSDRAVLVQKELIPSPLEDVVFVEPEQRLREMKGGTRCLFSCSSG